MLLSHPTVELSAFAKTAIRPLGTSQLQQKALTLLTSLSLVL